MFSEIFSTGRLLCQSVSAAHMPEPVQYAPFIQTPAAGNKQMDGNGNAALRAQSGAIF